MRMQLAMEDAKRGGALSEIVRRLTEVERWMRLVIGGTKPGRDVLTANRDYYVRTDGLDTNDGLANTSLRAFLTIQKAINVCYKLDLNGFTVYIHVADGTYGAGVLVDKPFLGGLVYLEGNAGTPANVVISCAGHCVNVKNFAVLYVAGFKFVSSANSGLVSESGGVINVYWEVEFGTCGYVHIYCSGGFINDIGPSYKITGGAVNHYACEDGGIIKFAVNTITLVGGPVFSTFATATREALLDAFAQTYVGAATGTRYWVTVNAVIFTNAGGPAYFPGTVGGGGDATGVYA